MRGARPFGPVEAAWSVTAVRECWSVRPGYAHAKASAAEKGSTVNEREMLEDLLKDAEAVVAKIKARLAQQTQAEVNDVSVSAGSAIERVQSQKTSDDTGNY